MRFFVLNGAEELGASIAAALGHAPAPHEERDFEGGEHKARPLTSVRDEDVFVLHDLVGDARFSVNDRLVRLLFFLAACRDHGAARVTAVTPCLAYGRKDRQTKARDPVTTRYVAQLFEAVGVDRIVTVDAHNIAAFQNAFRCETVHLDTRRLFTPTIRQLANGRPVTILSPDGGGIKRAQLLKASLETDTDMKIGFGLMEKRRSRGVVSGDLFAGSVEGTVVVIIDDMIVSGGTILRAAEACREHGAASVHAFAAHGMFDSAAVRLFSTDAIDSIAVTDSTAAAARAKTAFPAARLDIIGVGDLIGQAITRLHSGGSIADLLGMEE
ncbi:ribose-phosphate diphosphokinase [Fodinicurvata sp. EGI_FJ10296]|uniref:ribose-phosphate diphosphokinase n=1 Tax=Fodinicurvata sp. EGI_FJ10296 TaxID=3231908 RepID=UPI00345232D0